MEPGASEECSTRHLVARKAGLSDTHPTHRSPTTRPAAATLPAHTRRHQPGARRVGKAKSVASAANQAECVTRRSQQRKLMRATGTNPRSKSRPYQTRRPRRTSWLSSAGRRTGRRTFGRYGGRHGAFLFCTNMLPCAARPSGCGRLTMDGRRPDRVLVRPAAGRAAPG